MEKINDGPMIWVEKKNCYKIWANALGSIYLEDNNMCWTKTKTKGYFHVH